MDRPVDLGLYLVTDAAIASERALARLVEGAIDGGVTCVQVREKSIATRLFLDRVRAVLSVARPNGVTVLVNDRVDVALAAGADGVHLGQDDLPPREARRLLGPGRTLGVTAGDPEAARRAEADGADYLGSTAVFRTATKPDAGDPIGLHGLAAIVRAVRIPVIGIGGIDAANAASVLATGAAGIAVVTAITRAESPRAASAALAAVVHAARAGVPR